MGYKIRVKQGDTKTNPWQNLWMRFATDKDKKHDLIKGSNSRFYKFNLIQRNKYKRPNDIGFTQFKSKNKDFVKKKFDRKEYVKDKIAERRKERKEDCDDVGSANEDPEKEVQEVEEPKPDEKPEEEVKE